MNLYGKILFWKRVLAETVNSGLNNVYNIGHTRHHSIENFASNQIARLIVKNIDNINKSKLIV